MTSRLWRARGGLAAAIVRRAAPSGPHRPGAAPFVRRSGPRARIHAAAGTHRPHNDKKRLDEQ